jgi:hypothetical protein
MSRKYCLIALLFTLPLPAVAHAQKWGIDSRRLVNPTRRAMRQVANAFKRLGRAISRPIGYQRGQAASAWHTPIKDLVARNGNRVATIDERGRRVGSVPHLRIVSGNTTFRELVEMSNSRAPAVHPDGSSAGSIPHVQIRSLGNGRFLVQ